MRISNNCEDIAPLSLPLPQPLAQYPQKFKFKILEQDFWNKIFGSRPKQNLIRIILLHIKISKRFSVRGDLFPRLPRPLIHRLLKKNWSFTLGDESSPQRMRRTVVEDTSAEGYDAIVLSSKCTTTRGKRGTCRKIEECYPFLFPLNKTVEQHVTTMNPELAHILIQISGICDMETSGADRISPQSKENNFFLRNFRDFVWIF